MHRINSINRVVTAFFDESILSTDQIESIDIVGRVLLFLNSAINPTLYALSSRFYRQAFVEAVSSCCWCRRENPSSQKTAKSAQPESGGGNSGSKIGTEFSSLSAAVADKSERNWYQNTLVVVVSQMNPINTKRKPNYPNMLPLGFLR